MGLEKYKEIRDFDRTVEPPGTEDLAPGDRFVVQRHAARRLHYDFRLEIDGVLKSWAIPKGPSLDPEVKRLAVHTEDHPLAYADFEGVIPKGEYGAGEVVVWDRGRFVAEGDPAAGYRKGHLKFRLEGERLRGSWNLIRLRSQDKGWLLVKVADDAALAGSGDLVVERERGSVLGRERPRPAVAPAARPAKASKFEPQLATLVDAAPDGDGWLHEIKFDGYRVLLHLRDGEPRFLTRNGHDWTAKLAALVPDARALRAREAVIDGEVVVFEPDGRTRFNALQNALGSDGGRGGEHAPLVFQAFDLLSLDGEDLRDVPLEARKDALAELLPGDGRLRYTDHVAGAGPLFFAEACRLGLEGIISKRRDGKYRGGRSRSWLKVKCIQRQEFVIGGYTPPKGGRTAFGALLLGVREGDRLRYVGKVGTGFDEKTLKALHAKMQGLEAANAPFAEPPKERGARWIAPNLVAEVAFTEWTPDGVLRHPSFQGLREDKAPAEVVRERPVRGKGRVDVAGVSLSSPDKVLWAGQGITKVDLAEHYAAVAEAMLPHVADRPLTLVRCPDGQGAECFFQKHAREHLHAALRPIEVPAGPGTGKKSSRYIALDDARGLVALVQMGVLEVHVWGSRCAHVEKPDRVVFDLDPDPSVGADAVVEAALDVRDRLAALGLRSFALATGGKGLHVVVPLRPRLEWDDIRAFAKAFAERLAKDEPDRFTAALAKARRTGRIFIDHLRNGRGATAIAPWSTRARPGAPVAVPLAWDEVAPGLNPSGFGLDAARARLALDPWAGYFDVKQSITAAARRALEPKRR
jgi:bifunctional non-homologous end joining protein LigD